MTDFENLDRTRRQVADMAMSWQNVREALLSICDALLAPNGAEEVTPTDPVSVESTDRQRTAVGSAVTMADGAAKLESRADLHPTETQRKKEGLAPPVPPDAALRLLNAILKARSGVNGAQAIAGILHRVADDITIVAGRLDGLDEVLATAEEAARLVEWPSPPVSSHELRRSASAMRAAGYYGTAETLQELAVFLDRIAGKGER